MFYRIAIFFATIYVKIFYRLKVIGKENIPQLGRFIICAKHKSNLDAVFLACACPRKIHFMAKKELFKNKIISRILYSLGAFPVDRKKADVSSIKKALSILKNEHCLGIYPEGTRTSTIDKTQMKNGIGLIAIKSQTDVITATVVSDYKLFHKTTILINEPISIDDYLKQEKKVAIAQLADKIFDDIYKDGAITCK